MNILEIEEKETTIGEAIDNGALLGWSESQLKWASENRGGRFFTYAYRGYILGSTMMEPAILSTLQDFARDYIYNHG